MTSPSLQTDAPLEASRFESYPREAVAFLDELDSGGLLLDAPYQRGSVWTPDQQRNLIRSFLMGLPIPAIILNDRATYAWADANGAREHVYAVIDGKQRIEASIAWFRGELDVPASWFAQDWVAQTHPTPDGPYVNEGGLTDKGRRFVRRQAKMPTAVASVATVAQEAHIFALVNCSGTAQDAATLAAAARIAAGETV